MTRQDQRTHPSAPGWRATVTLAALVVAAHALVLQASPSRLGSELDAGSKSFTTRNIEASPAATAAAAPGAAGTPATPAPAKAPLAAKTTTTSQSSPKKAPESPQPQQIQASAATEIVANAEVPPVTLPAADAPATSPTAATPSQATAASAAAPATQVTAVTLPGSARLKYNVIGMSKNLNYQATAELDWKTNGEKYEAMMKVSAFLVGSRSMTSVGQITGTGLAPTRFADKFKAELAAHFEADKGKITFSANTPDAPWNNGVQDRVSVFLQLAGMLAANPAGFPSGSNITFVTIGPREADSWTFVIEAEENLELMNAPMAALKLTRKPRKEFDQKVEIWFAPSLGYLPVRSRITQHGGDFVDQQLTQVVKSM